MNTSAMSTSARIALALALTAGLTACGGSDNAATSDSAPAATRTIDVTMTDMAFAPSALDVAAGETVTFRFRNDGAARHEAVLGDLAAQEQHHAEMAEAASHMTETGTMDMNIDVEHSSDMHGVVVQPGDTIEFTHTFDAPADLMFGCHEPGHWEAGMRLDVRVAPAGTVSS